MSARPRPELSPIKRALLARRLAGPGGPAASTLGRRQGEGPQAWSFAQERLWFLDRMTPGSPIYNIPAALRLRGRLDVAALAGSLKEIGRRHAVLRTSFREVGGRPLAVAGAPALAELPLIDLTALPAGERERLALRLAAAEVRRAFDLGSGPLARARLLRLGEREHLLLLTQHHIVSDGWSIGVIVRELGALYRASALGHPSPPCAPP